MTSVKVLRLCGFACCLILAPASLASISAAPNPNSGSYTVSWTAVISPIAADDYVLHESGPGVSNTYGNFGTNPSISFSGKAPNTYTYTVDWCFDWDLGGQTQTSCSGTGYAPLSVTVGGGAPPEPGPITGPSTSYTGSYSLSWGSSTGATSYTVQEKVGSGAWATIQNTSATSKSFTGKANATYYYRVKACAGSNCSAWTATKSVLVRPPDDPSSITGPSPSYTGSYSLGWGSSTGATKYTLQEKVGSGAWSTIQNTSATSKSFSGKTNATYYYRARACAASNCSAWTATKSVLVRPPDVPGSISGPSDSYTGSYSISWGSSTGATKYTLQEKFNSGAWSTIQDTSATTKSFSGRSDASYSYRARACAGSNCSTWTAIHTVQVLNTPDGVEIQAPSYSTDGFYTVEWNEAVEGTVDSYYLQEQVNGGPNWTEVQNTAALSWTVPTPGKAPGTYAYSVAACNALSCSDPSPVVTVNVADLGNIEPPATIEAADAAGSADYGVTVDGSGDARIQVPIAVPPGVNGLAPDLALTYSSGGAKTEMDARRIPGLLGYGWALSGISELRRCRIGVSGDVDLTNSDRLCLDGQPLVAVNGSTYWANGAEYRTQRQTLVKVIGHGTGASAWFEVFLPDGRVARYGDTASSRTAPMQSTTPYLWSIRHVQDAFGNVLTISYFHNEAGGTLYPVSIDYAGAQIELFYTTRSDTESLVYSASGFVQSAKRMVALSRIAISVNGTDVREYRLRNAEHPGEGYLHLRDVQVCGYDAAGIAKECLDPISFTWSTNAGAPDEFLCAVTKVTDGLGATTEMDYTLVSGASNPLTYSESPFGSVTAPPNTTPVTASRRVVDEVRRPDGLGGFWRTTYRYKAVPFTSTENRGYLGFSERRVTRHDVPDNDSSGNPVLRDITSYYQYRLDYPFVGQVSRQLNVLDNDVATPSAKLSYQEQAWDAELIHGGAVIMPFLARRAGEAYEDGAVISAAETEHELCFRALSLGTCPATGALLEHATQVITASRTGTGLTNPGFTPQFWGDVPDRAVTGEMSSAERTTVLENAPSEWILGFVSQVTTTLDTPAEPAVTRTTARTRVAGTRRVESTVGFPQDPDLELMVFNSFDLNGNLSQIQVSGQDVPLRTGAVSGYLDQRYPQSVTNAESHVTDLDYDVRFGAADEVTDPDGLITSSTLDTFGRALFVQHPDGTTQTIDYDACGTTLCTQVTWADVAVRATASADNGGVQTAPTVRIYRDVLGREVLRETEAFSPTEGWVRVETHYDPAGRVVMQSAPYFSAGGTPQYLNAFHDVTGRLVREERPDGGVTVTAYDAAAGELTITVTETVKTPGQADETRVKRSLFDARGLLTSTTDAFGTADAVTTTYAYDSASNLANVTVDGQEVASMAYDAAGRRISIDEVNTGLTTFELDALGRLRSQTNAKGQTNTFDYDDLDRLTQRVDAWGSWSRTHTWSWDPVNATGSLASRSRPGFTETLAYDTLGRLDQATTDVSMGWLSAFPGNGSFVMDVGYDAQGRPSTVTWPSGLTITRDYTARGYRSAVREGATVLEETQAVDAYGQVTRSDFGNGLATVRGFDVVGRLTSISTGTSATPVSIQDLEYTWRSNSTLYQRQDHQGTASTADDIVETFSYDNLDRLTEADTDHPAGTRILTFGYDAVGNLTAKTSSVAGDLNVTGYQYTGPHRLTSAVIDGVSTSFQYDATGNITRYNAASGDDTVIQYGVRGEVIKITVGSTQDQFWHGPDGERYLKRSTWDDGGTQKEKWTLYLFGGAYEEVHVLSDPQVLYRQQVQVTPTVVHRRTVDPTFTATSTIEYRHRDHLGSVDKVTDESGNVISSLAFDPYGERRNPDGTMDLTPAGLDLILNGDSITQRGFTDHEHLDRTGFIHMNGRVYDPRIGRFLQPDPVVSLPSFSQSYNRYAYVLNSPLNFTDPSGFELNGTPSFGSTVFGGGVLSWAPPAILGNNCFWVCGGNIYVSTAPAKPTPPPADTPPPGPVDPPAASPPTADPPRADPAPEPTDPDPGAGGEDGSGGGGSGGGGGGSSGGGSGGGGDGGSAGPVPAPMPDPPVPGQPQSSGRVSEKVADSDMRRDIAVYGEQEMVLRQCENSIIRSCRARLGSIKDQVLEGHAPPLGQILYLPRGLIKPPPTVFVDVLNEVGSGRVHVSDYGIWATCRARNEKACGGDAPPWPNPDADAVDLRRFELRVLEAYDIPKGQQPFVTPNPYE